MSQWRGALFHHEEECDVETRIADVEGMAMAGLSNCYFNSTRHLQANIEAYAQLIERFTDAGWDCYLFSVMFHYLPGSRDNKIIQMHQQVDRYLYRRLATKMVRKPQSLKWAHLLPIAIFIPDLPVPKFHQAKKLSIADVSINEGLHMHGIVLGNRWGRLQIGLDKHFETDMASYLTDKIRHIDVKPITHDHQYAVGYALKGLVRRTASPDDIRILNWGGSAFRAGAL